MTLKTIFLYHFGHGGAIREVAANRHAPWIGLLLVLSAGIARQYDQSYFPADPGPFIVPLVVSTLNALFQYVLLLLILGKTTATDDAPASKTWRIESFLGCFWMMAPMAWLYAIPVERLFDSRTAASINLGLLGVVSAWRVALLTRVVSLLTGHRWTRVLCVVLLGSSMVLGLGSIVTSMSVIRFMGGLTFSPERGIALDAAGSAFGAAVLGFPLFALLVALYHPPARPASWPESASGSAPWAACVAFLLAGAALALGPQAELACTRRAEILLQANLYDEFFAFVAGHAPGDFAPARRLPPDPYDFDGFRHLPSLMERLEESHPAWLRDRLLDHYAVVTHHADASRYREELHQGFCRLLERMGATPGGKTWLVARRAAVLSVHDHLVKATFQKQFGAETTAREDLLRKIGVLSDPR